MKLHKSNKWAWVVILASVVAVLTTLAVFLLRSRMKKKTLSGYNDTIDYDFDDCCCCSGDEDNNGCCNSDSTPDESDETQDIDSEY